MLPTLKNLNYEERLKILKLPTLKFRRMRGDMIETYKILTGIYDYRVTTNFLVMSSNNYTRGNTMKLKKERSRLDIRKHSFTSRIVDIWNSLPEHVVSAKTMYSFENRLDRHWMNQPMKQDFTSDFVCTTGRRQEVNPYIELNIEAQ